ncbi:toll-like receptor 2 type-1 [Mytilus californianus]|uniref:toll-like receptor 2 type-1 n=1 Tax=Mytilus californianus TaxID=6549 RepID=UPI002247A8B4|nr:toll-like receptor 2 type-1 [Mytilus californianus]
MKLIYIFCAVFSLFGKVSAKPCKTVYSKGYKRADCRYLQLKTIPPNIPGDIDVLDLSENLISVLENNSFVQFSNLKELLVSKNNISRIEKKVFYPLTQLKVLDISGNNIRNISNQIHPEMFQFSTNLYKLDIRRNMKDAKRIQSDYTYPGAAFSLLSNLTILYMDLVPKPVFGPEFKSLVKLEVLGFDYCLLAAMTNDLFKHFTMKVRELHLMRCHDILGENVKYGSLQYFKHLKVLNLADTHIHLIRALDLLHSFQNTTMDVINFQRVSYELLDNDNFSYALVITSEMMKYLRTICVKTLNLADNGIVDFRENSLLSYDHPECFENIVLSANRFTFHIGRKMKEILTLIHKLKNVVLFDFSYNPIRFSNETYLRIPNGNTSFDYEATGCFSDGFMNGPGRTIIYLPPKLKILRFSHFVRQSCGDGFTVRNASSLEQLDMSYYQFQKFPDLKIEGENNLKSLNMSGIDSSLYLKKKSVPPFNNVEEAFFRHVELGKSQAVSKHLFTLIPSVQVLDLSYNSLWTLPQDAFVENKKLTELDLSNNVLHEVPVAILEIKQLRKLNLQNNNLVSISKSITDWLDSLTRKQDIYLLLAGNVFSCTCENRQFISWLFNTKVQLDPDNQNISNKNYSCRLSNGEVKGTSEIYDQYHELYSDCNAGIWLRFGISLLVTFTVIAFIFAVIFNFRWRIAYYIYRTFKTVIESKMNLKFTYDAYVAYSEDAKDWVKYDLAQKIEKIWGLKLCIEDRDLLAGKSYIDSIAEAIGSCRQVIFVLSPGLLDREWTQYEIERAKYEMACKHVQITVLNLGTAVQEVPAEFSSIWHSVCLIEWSEDPQSADNPWHKLKLRLVLNR